MTALPIATDRSVSAVAAPNAGAIAGTYARLPLRIVRGEGVELISDDGRRILDMMSGIGVNALGYDTPVITRAIARALENGIIHVSNLVHTDPAEKLAEWLVSHSFASSVFFSNSGAEANEGAFKFARRWARELGGDRKHEIVALRGAFHGRLFASLAATDRPAYRAPFRPLAGGVSILERDLEVLDAALDPETVAGVIVEPVQGEGGVRVLDAGFLRALRQMTSERGVALIFDEVQCGLGRTGTLFAYEQSGVVPDLLTLAKPLAGGLPMGAVLIAPHIASAIRPGDHASTFGGGPLVATVAQAVVEHIAESALLDSVKENGAWLGEQLAKLAAASPNVRDVRGVGYMWGIDTAPRAKDIVAAALERDVLLCSAGDHTIRLLPPLVATRDDLARGLAVLGEVLS